MNNKKKKHQESLCHLSELRAINAMLQSLYEAYDSIQNGPHDSLYKYTRDELVADLFAAIEILEKMECRE